MDIKTVSVEIKAVKVVAFMTPREYENYVSSYAQPNIVAEPTDTGYFVESKNGAEPLMGWLEKNYAKQYQEVYGSGIAELVKTLS